MDYHQKGSAKLVKLGVMLAICSILVIAVMLLPKGFKDDLSLVGQGTVSVVLTHDKNLVGGTTMMALLNDIRPDYQGRVQFLAVDVVTPVGQAFLQEQRVGLINLVIFGPDGTRDRVLSGNTTEQQLRAVLDEVLQ